LVNKVQLLLDATLGLINVEQNNIIKVLTIVSVVGVPPTLVASIYGMNFKGMPEYDWSWGYPYGLVMIALSAVLPLLWFKWRGWILPDDKKPPENRGAPFFNPLLPIRGAFSQIRAARPHPTGSFAAWPPPGPRPPHP